MLNKVSMIFDELRNVAYDEEQDREAMHILCKKHEPVWTCFAAIVPAFCSTHLMPEDEIQDLLDDT